MVAEACTKAVVAGAIVEVAVAEACHLQRSRMLQSTQTEHGDRRKWSLHQMARPRKKYQIAECGHP